ncbi:MAG: hypothetical protein COT90_00840 [Candidatus Diapherotrites archaeon CG10_big_fil_rev_8_21_14_0_10_31_34]|nr:MAG: hypothetical protein COT90_00840 [Candidatus Diapherotrites archaeon CG10_big_fil_rev_8_21_14_0_10_31_34]
MKEEYSDIAKKLDSNQIQNKPILDISAKFWDEERYLASKKLYKPMRLMDDLVDNRKALSEISETEKEQFSGVINAWVESINQGKPQDEIQKQLIETIEEFRIPFWPWQDFAKAMVYDIKNNGFKSFQDFLDYTEGAAVAPAAIALHLAGVKKHNGNFIPPSYNIKKAARSIATFCYLVHIIRDFQKDQSSNLNYFAEDLILENGLTKKALKQMANGKKKSKQFRNLMKKYYSFAEDYKNKAVHAINEISSSMEPRYKLSLEIAFNLYLQVFEKINISKGNFTSEELNPSPQEIKEIINKTITETKE